MNDKQPIEVGQVWRTGLGHECEVLRVSPAWATVMWADKSSNAIRKSQLRGWTIVGTNVPPMEDAAPDEPANTSTHAAMQAAVAAFNAQTGLRLTEAHGWQLMLNLHLAANRTGESIHAFGDQVFALYQESREVD